VFWFFSSWDFSFILTLSTLVQAFGFILLTLKVSRAKSISGLSRNTLVCYAICLFARLSSILVYEGYLPYDSTGDFIYRACEIATFASCGILLYFSFVAYKRSYNAELDTFKWYYFTVPALIFAMLFHPSLNMRYYADVAWTFALYLESTAMLP